MACSFCSLETEKSRTVRHSRLTTVVLSNPRLMIGHALVIPNRHVEHPGELTEQELLAIFKDIDDVRSRLLASIATGVDVRQNYRPFLAQSKTKVEHVHFHVLPRTLEDDLYERSMKFEAGIFSALGKQETARMVKLFSDQTLP